MAVAKVRNDQALEPISVPVTRRALVIGGGVAGIQAALDIADAGYEVVMVEREPSIGGKMAGLSETFPTLDCSQCILTPRMVDVGQHPSIKLYTYSEVEAVEGFVGNFKITIRKKARYVDIAKCTGCGECWNVCPSKKNPSAVRLRHGHSHGDLHSVSAGGAGPAGDRQEGLHPAEARASAASAPRSARPGRSTSRTRTSWSTERSAPWWWPPATSSTTSVKQQDDDEALRLWRIRLRQISRT